MRKLATFGAVGALASVVHIAVAFVGLRGLGMGIFWANALGFAVAFAWSYGGHYYLTFRTKAAHQGAVIKFGVVALLGFGVNSGVVMVWRAAAGGGAAADSIWAVVLGVAVAAAVTFLAANFWAFARR